MCIGANPCPRRRPPRHHKDAHRVRAGLHPPEGPLGILEGMSPPIYYESDDAASVALAEADPALGAVIDRVGTVTLSPPSDPFVALVRSVVGQQLSERAARAIFGRLSASAGVTPEALASAAEREFREVGLSHQKASYVRDIARGFLSGEFDPMRLEAMGDDRAISELMRLRGVGPWSAEMFLMFALARPDVLAVDDLGVRAEAGSMMGLGRPANRDELLERAERWKPHRSAASFYLMASRATSRRRGEDR